MKIIYFLNKIFILIFVLLLLIGNTTAQTIGIQQAQDISRGAQELTLQKRWEEAKRILQEGLQNCGSSEEAKECRSILHFSLGFLYYHMSEEDSINKTKHLDKASEFYQLALSDSPNDFQILNNLAFVQWDLGNFQQAVNFLKKAKDIDTKNPDIYFALGDLYREINSLQKALDAYKLASKIDPLDETSYRRILSVYSRFPVDDLNKTDNLFKYSEELKRINQTAVAKNALELVIDRSINRKEPLAERALMVWAEMGASQGWLSKKSLITLPNEKEWSSPAINELRGLLIDPMNAISRLLWWKRGLVQTHVAAYIMMSIGNQFLVDGNIEDSEKVFEYAYEIAPHLTQYFNPPLSGTPIIKLDISSELASIYLNYPDLDQSGKKIEQLIRTLFEEKGIAYEMLSEFAKEESLATIQKCHTILGLIFADQGKWTSDWSPGNAIFQLEHALKFAEKRKEENPKYFQPQPYLQSLLGKGYEYEKVNRRKEALSIFIDAAIGYLDLDSLNQSEEMILKAESLLSFGSSVDKEKLIKIKNILDSRKKISELQENNLIPNSSDYFGKSGIYRWLLFKDDLALDPSSLNRQRFKAFADLGNRATQLELSQDAIRFHSDALEVIKNENVFTNMGDIVRLEKIKNTVLQNINIKKSKRIISTGQNLDKSPDYEGGKIWWLTTASEPYSIQVAVDFDFLLAGKIANRFSIDPSLGLRPPRLEIGEGQVTIIREQTSYEIIKEAEGILQNIEGIKQVKIKKER